jgi:hypothetical protein
MLKYRLEESNLRPRGLVKKIRAIPGVYDALIRGRNLFIIFFDEPTAHEDEQIKSLITGEMIGQRRIEVIFARK